MTEPDTTDVDGAAPRDPFEALRAASAAILETQLFRGPGASAAIFHEQARAEHGDALAAARRALDVLDPPVPALSVAITPELLRAADFTQTAAADDEGERRDAARLWRAALDPPPLRPRRPWPFAW